ncbi:unnamed protein product [Pleuronectes platessa]|uniref:Uncharacterized protein n=1 Tax=Pleuronectes platessa TaxID=8262 RepID=A0A9N7UGI7_PLEPL|nr:unnamed protein product [Pleuronectes platessa]
MARYNPPLPPAAFNNAIHMMSAVVSPRPDVNPAADGRSCVVRWTRVYFTTSWIDSETPARGLGLGLHARSTQRDVHDWRNEAEGPGASDHAPSIISVSLTRLTPSPHFPSTPISSLIGLKASTLAVDGPQPPPPRSDWFCHRTYNQPTGVSGGLNGDSIPEITRELHGRIE